LKLSDAKPKWSPKKFYLERVRTLIYANEIRAKELSGHISTIGKLATFKLARGK
jgi:hypothetical protein